MFSAITPRYRTRAGRTPAAAEASNSAVAPTPSRRQPDFVFIMTKTVVYVLNKQCVRKGDCHCPRHYGLPNSHYRKEH